MIAEPNPRDSRGPVAMAKSIGDLDDLIKLLSKGLSRAKPWQQRCAAQLSEMDCLLQVLRLTIALVPLTRRFWLRPEICGPPAGRRATPLRRHEPTRSRKRRCGSPPTCPHRSFRSWSDGRPEASQEFSFPGNKKSGGKATANQRLSVLTMSL
jgi:hypothetical protein